MDYETLSKHNPKLIYAINSGYGLEGPVNNERAFDTIGQARSGLMWSVGDRDQNEPYQTVSAPCDQVGATMLAYSLLAALVARERQGIGQQIEVSLLGSAIHMQGIIRVGVLLVEQQRPIGSVGIKNPVRVQSGAIERMEVVLRKDLLALRTARLPRPRHGVHFPVVHRDRLGT